MSFIRIVTFCCCFGMFLGAVNTYATTVNGVRIWRAPDHTRIVLDLDSPVIHRLSEADNPARVIIDIPKAQLDPALLTTLPLANTPVTSVRSSMQNKTDVRLVLDLSTKVSPRSFLLKAGAGMHDRLVIDLYDEQPLSTCNPAVTTDLSNQANCHTSGLPPGEALPARSAKVGKNPAASDAAPAVVASSDVVQPTKPKSAVASGKIPLVDQPLLIEPSDLGGKRPIIIAVDAGHGGEDPGAMGPNRLREKEVTLAIARELVAAINAQTGFVGKLIRTGDYFIPLKKRRDIARSMKADLFISIHADAFTKPAARGASVFALSRTGATSETARFLAQRENESDLIGGVGDISLGDKDQVLAGVLVDLSMTATLNSSLQIGNHVLSSMGSIAHLHKRHVEQAGFMVLKAPDVPSILVETGFISNPDEARKLASPAYRKQMAQSVFKGVRQYFMQHPPAGTLVATQMRSGGIKGVERQHTVGSGDTLSAIATRYGITMKRLMQHNRLRDSSVKVGQTLKIPAA